ncbi:unnamed protein product [Callosobruchus maculatus]|uniref:Reverse transcriptase domain-containing protein n=1 Tax=Callosobruchus maculatus TaxID=64391 RepID=A0A653BEU7_CALMS|nr:unnamed protein product [Callosobruchus maculatus]
MDTYYFSPSDLITANSELQGDMDKIYEYSASHNLEINPGKTNLLIFCSDNKRSHITENIRILIGNDALQIKNSAKILGVEVDVKLRFTNYINSLAQKTYLRMRSLYSCRYLMNFKLRKKLSETLVMSCLGYCNILYFPCLDQHTKNRLQIIQNNCVRFVCNLKKFDHVTQSYSMLRWLKLENLVQYHYLLFIHKVLTTSKPDYLREKIIFNQAIHNRIIRNKLTIRIPPHNTSFFQRSFSYNVAVRYNSLENMYKNMSLPRFRRYVKLKLLS